MEWYILRFQGQFFSLIYISGSELLPWRLDLPGNSSAGKNRNINNNDNLLTLLWATCTTIVFQRVRNEKDMLQTCGAIYGPIVESAEWVDSALDSSSHSCSIIESMQGLQSLITSTSHPSLLNCDQSESVNTWLHCTHLRETRSCSHALKTLDLWDSSNLNLRLSHALSTGQ